MVKCTSWFGHKYRPRYSKSEPTITRLGSCSEHTALQVIEKSRRKTYVHDICVRCGHIIHSGGRYA